MAADRQDDGESDGGSEGDQSSAREQPRRGRLKHALEWFLLDGDRLTLVVLLSALTFAIFLALGLLDLIAVEEASLVVGAFTAAITGVFTLISITISINQLVLSRVMGSPGRIQDRTESVRAFRQTVQRMDLDAPVVPTEPAAFLKVVMRVLRNRAKRLRTVYDESHDPHLRRRLDEEVQTIVDQTHAVDRAVGPDRVDLFSVLSPILNNSYSAHIYAVRRVQAQSDTLTEPEEQAFDALLKALNTTNRTRHYFKTLYLHMALATTSRLVFVTGVPALLLNFAVIFYYAQTEPVASVSALLLVSASVAAVLVPLYVLFVYALRVATIAKRTTTVGTFTPAEEMP